MIHTKPQRRRPADGHSDRAQPRPPRPRHLRAVPTTTLPGDGARARALFALAALLDGTDPDTPDAA